MKQEEVINIANIQSRLGNSVSVLLASITQAKGPSTFTLLLRALRALIAPIQIVVKNVPGSLAQPWVCRTLSRGWEACLARSAGFSILFMINYLL